MVKEDNKKDDKTELELIKSSLNIDLDETTVDIFSEDLFAPTEKKPLRPTSATGEKKQSPEPAQKEPKAKPEVKKEREKPSEDLELEIEAGDFKSVAVAREEEKLAQTQTSMAQLEKMGGDLLSTKEIKKLFQNVNIIIDLLYEMEERIKRLERALKDKGVL